MINKTNKKGIAGLLLVCLFVISGFAYKKGDGREKNSPNYSIQSLDTIVMPDLLGAWEWIESHGGIANIIAAPSNCKCTKKILFKDNGEYEQYYNDTLKLKLKFFVAKQLSPLTSRPATIINTINSEGQAYPLWTITIENNILRLGETEVDGLGHIYKKKK